jgi:hypothetical protein
MMPHKVEYAKPPYIMQLAVQRGRFLKMARFTPLLTMDPSRFSENGVRWRPVATAAAGRLKAAAGRLSTHAFTAAFSAIRCTTSGVLALLMDRPPIRPPAPRRSPHQVIHSGSDHRGRDAARACDGQSTHRCTTTAVFSM